MLPKNSTTFRDVYAQITNRVLEQMERAVAWQKPWSFGAPDGSPLTRPVNLDGRPYSGINVVLLWSAGQSAATWGTFNAWKKLGASVRKGEKGTEIVFFKRYEKTVTNAAGEENDESFMVARGYHVFNLAQVEGAPAKYLAPIEPVAEEARNQRAERFFRACGIKMKFGGNRAFYIPSADYVQMPAYRSFIGTKTSGAADAYYATACHELTHATGHVSRLDRDFSKSKRWGDEAYAAEELVAEMGSAYLCADLGITISPRQDHANYLANWIKVLKGDKRAIFTAASKAEAACKWLHVAAGEETADEAPPVVIEPVALPEPAPAPQRAPARPVGAHKWSKRRQAERREITHKPARHRDDYERTALAYCRWLAERDGIELASAYDSRQSVVIWGATHIRAVKLETKTGEMATIVIPNHDWKPTTIDQLAIAA